jgi:hypothetical protein
MEFIQEAKIMDNKRLPISDSTIELCIAQERLRQARYSFNLALVATTASFLVSLTGAGLLLSNKIPEGSVIAADGLVSSVRCIQLAKDANDRLDKIMPEPDDENN